MGREHGLSDEDFNQLEDFETSTRFSEEEKRVLEYVTELSGTHVQVDDALFDGLKEDFDQRQLVEITALAAWENYRSRFNRGFDVQPQGFSDAAVCRIPEDD